MKNKVQTETIEAALKTLRAQLLKETNSDNFIELASKINALTVRLKAKDFVRNQIRHHLPSHGEPVAINEPVKIIYYGNIASLKF